MTSRWTDKARGFIGPVVPGVEFLSQTAARREDLGGIDQTRVVGPGGDVVQRFGKYEKVTPSSPKEEKIDLPSKTVFSVVQIQSGPYGVWRKYNLSYIRKTATSDDCTISDTSVANNMFGQQSISRWSAERKSFILVTYKQDGKYKVWVSQVSITGEEIKKVLVQEQTLSIRGVLYLATNVESQERYYVYWEFAGTSEAHLVAYDSNLNLISDKVVPKTYYSWNAYPDTPASFWTTLPPCVGMTGNAALASSWGNSVVRANGRLLYYVVSTNFAYYTLYGYEYQGVFPVWTYTTYNVSKYRLKGEVRIGSRLDNRDYRVIKTILPASWNEVYVTAGSNPPPDPNAYSFTLLQQRLPEYVTVAYDRFQDEMAIGVSGNNNLGYYGMPYGGYATQVFSQPFIEIRTSNGTLLRTIPGKFDANAYDVSYVAVQGGMESPRDIAKYGVMT